MGQYMEMLNEATVRQQGMSETLQRDAAMSQTAPDEGSVASNWLGSCVT